MPAERLPAQRDRLEALAAVLEDEQRLLLEANYERLTELSERKIALLDELQSQATSIEQAHETTRDPAAAELWALLHRTRDMNRQNGRLISEALRYVENALQILRGPNPAGYDAWGNLGKSCQQRHPLGSA